MVRALSLSLALVLGVSAAPLAAQDTHQGAAHDFRVVTVVDGLDTPWSMAFLPGGDMLVTERPGRLRIVRDGRLLPSPVGGVPEVYARGQGGLLEVAAHPDFSSNRLVYLTYSKPLTDGSTTAVIRGRFENDRLTNVEEIFEARSSGSGHYGSRLAFDGDGYLYITVGDRQAPSTGNLEAHPAQDLSNHHGVTIRLHDDGRVPADNPFVNQPGALPEIYSYGHRNAQGLAVHPESGEVWLNEHGPQGGDEVNVVRAGANYGWPVVGYGVNYRDGSAIHEGTHRPGMEQPIHVWVPSIGVSGLAFYTGSQFPGWQGDAFAGGLSGGYLARLDIEDGEILREEVLLPGIGRVRDVRQGPDGYLYLAVEARDGVLTPIVRLEPVATRN
ncbi:MAG: PQQ-dependent sugar dehydrogenase [Gemmatimonadota bacterium]